MQVNIEDVSPVEKRLTVEIPWTTVQSKLGDAYKEVAREVNLRGFRKGKVPRSVIERMFGKKVRAEVASQLVREGFVQAVQQHSLAVVTEPKVDETEMVIKKGEAFVFHAQVEVRTNIELEEKDYADLELKRHPIGVSDSQIDEMLERLQKENTDLIAIEGRDITARTDVVTVALKGQIAGENVDQPGVTVDLEEEDREPLPGLVAALTGIPIDVEDHPIKLDLGPAPDGGESRIADLVATIKDARQKQVPAIDDELAKDTGRAENLEELRKVLREELEKRAAEETQRNLREAALKELVERHPVPVAQGLVDRTVDAQMMRFKAMLGIPMEEDASDKLGDEARERLAEGALKDVRGELLLETIAEREKIEVDAKEVDEQVEKIARMQGKQAGRLKAELDRDGQLDGIRYNLRRDKILDLLVERAKVVDVTDAELAADAKRASEAPASDAGGAAAEAEREAESSPAASDTEVEKDQSDEG